MSRSGGNAPSRTSNSEAGSESVTRDEIEIIQIEESPDLHCRPHHHQRTLSISSFMNIRLRTLVGEQESALHEQVDAALNSFFPSYQCHIDLLCRFLIEARREFAVSDEITELDFDKGLFHIMEGHSFPLFNALVTGSVDVDGYFDYIIGSMTDSRIAVKHMRCLYSSLSRLRHRLLMPSFQLSLRELLDDWRIDFDAGRMESSCLRLRQRIDDLYAEKGFVWDGYFSYVDRLHPFYQAARGTLPLRPELFELGTGSWSSLNGETLDEEIRKQDVSSLEGLQRIGQLAAKCACFPRPCHSWSNKDLKKAILDAGLKAAASRHQRGFQESQEDVSPILNLSLITGRDDHRGIILPGLGMNMKVSSSRFVKLFADWGKKAGSDYLRLVYRRLYGTIIHQDLRAFSRLKYRRSQIKHLLAIAFRSQIDLLSSLNDAQLIRVISVESERLTGNNEIENTSVIGGGADILFHPRAFCLLSEDGIPLLFLWDSRRRLHRLNPELFPRLPRLVRRMVIGTQIGDYQQKELDALLLSKSLPSKISDSLRGVGVHQLLERLRESGMVSVGQYLEPSRAH